MSAEEKDALKGGVREQALNIPFRMQQVLISWVFIFASCGLLSVFVSLRHLLLFLGQVGDDPYPITFFAQLCNWFGVMSCLSWLFGFICLAHWLHQVKATLMGLLGCYLKLLASCIFNVQPMTGTMAINDGAGITWTNLLGISLFHIGNCVSCYDFYKNTPPGASKTEGWRYHGNLPVTGMWVYQVATWFLVLANVLSLCTGSDNTGLDGPKPTVLWKDSTNPVLFFLQIIGAGLLLVGSLIYTYWCDGFRNFKY